MTLASEARESKNEILSDSKKLVGSIFLALGDPFSFVHVCLGLPRCSLASLCLTPHGSLTLPTGPILKQPFPLLPPLGSRDE
jgi:hypothetical protein